MLAVLQLLGFWDIRHNYVSVNLGEDRFDYMWKFDGRVPYFYMSDGEANCNSWEFRCWRFILIRYYTLKPLKYSSFTYTCIP